MRTSARPGSARRAPDIQFPEGAPMTDDTQRIITRRELLAASAGVALVALEGGTSSLTAAPSPTARAPGRLKQSVCRWTYGSIPLPEFCRTIKGMGLAGIDLLQ